jgi:hypothetical protein
MARSISEIKAQMITAKNAETSLSGLDSTSQTSIWNLWIYIQAVAINLFEQILDVFYTNIETKVSNIAPQTPPWLKQKAFDFQYSATDPQQLFYVSNINGEIMPKYQIVNNDLKIITRCAIQPGFNRTVSVKVAKNEPPEKLDSAEINALQSYYDIIGNVGIVYDVISVDPDFIYLKADIYFSGAYYTTIQQSVIDALNAYFANTDFGGTIYVSQVEEVILSVVGVTDVKLYELSCRKYSTSWGDRNVVYSLSGGINGRNYTPYAGYVTEETTSGKTFEDQLNMIPS